MFIVNYNLFCPNQNMIILYTYWVCIPSNQVWHCPSLYYKYFKKMCTEIIKDDILIFDKKCKYNVLLKMTWFATISVLSVHCYRNKNNQLRPKINSLTNCVLHPSPCFCNNLLQDQLKFVYDTLEEFIVCGYTYFPVKDLSHHLKQKSLRKPGRKNNDYEREYAVRTKQNIE